MDLDSTISVLIIIIGVVCTYFGVQITLASKGKFRAVTILFGGVVGLIVIREIVRLTTKVLLAKNVDLITRIINLIIIITIFAGVLLMTSIVHKLEKNYKNGVVKTKSPQFKDNNKKQKITNKPVRKINKLIKGSYLNDEGYLVIPKMW